MRPYNDNHDDHDEDNDDNDDDNDDNDDDNDDNDDDNDDNDDDNDGDDDDYNEVTLAIEFLTLFQNHVPFLVLQPITTTKL